MGRAEDLFDRLRECGETTIDELIADRQSEELFLDFKRSADNGVGARLNPSDRANLAKAVSGFGNSEGGVIVWGVDCRDQPLDGDVARAKVPIQSPKRFKSWLEGAISGCTVPPHPRVRHLAIERAEPNADSGFVATLIPKSFLAPHQCVTPLQYYIRVGSDFVPTPHGVLAQLFGRRPRPFVFLWWTIEKSSTIPGPDGAPIVRFSVGYNLTSRGPGLARGLYLSLTLILPDGGSTFSYTTDPNWNGSFHLGARFGLVVRESFRLAPEGITTPLMLHVNLAPPFRGELVWTCWYGHEDSPVQMINRTVPASLIEGLYKNFVEGGDRGDELPKRVMDLPEMREPGPEGYEED
jgi:hypothetical protein